MNVCRAKEMYVHLQPYALPAGMLTLCHMSFLDTLYIN